LTFSCAALIWVHNEAKINFLAAVYDIMKFIS
jgi:hypothetical protein